MVLSRAFICLLFLCVCTAIANSQFPANGVGARWRTVASGSSSTETQQKLQLVSQANELDNYWSPVLRQNRAKPLVDFTKDRLVIVFLGTRNTGGFSARVSQVVPTGGASAILMVDEIVPDPKNPQTQALTSPWVMIAIDRLLLDLSMKVQKVADTTMPGSFQVNPLTTVTFVPWSPCGYGFGGNWNDPYCVGFDTPYDYGNWCNQNRIAQYNYGPFDFAKNRLVFISAGDYGLGYGLQIGDVFLSGSETVVQVTRNGNRVQSTDRSYVLIALSRQTRNVSVEYLVNSQECFYDSGILLPVRQAGSWVFQNRREMGRIVDLEQQTNSLRMVNSYDFKEKNLGIIVVPQQQPLMRLTIDRVAYRGQVAYVYMKRSATNSPMNMNIPYFALKLDKRIKSIKVVDPTNP